MFVSRGLRGVAWCVWTVNEWLREPLLYLLLCILCSCTVQELQRFGLDDEGAKYLDRRNATEAAYVARTLGNKTASLLPLFPQACYSAILIQKCLRKPAAHSFCIDCNSLACRPFNLRFASLCLPFLSLPQSLSSLTDPPQAHINRLPKTFSDHNLLEHFCLFTLLIPHHSSLSFRPPRHLLHC